ncbi:MAG: haloacid dehalogenase type II [Chloroflexi bacterium]|nr:haloacid dehalogenase type II [Chloroflexota bacterium]
MNDNPIDSVNTLTFDIFGTVLDLSGSLVPPISHFLANKDTSIDGPAFWAQWRARQRVEQYQDTILMLGHSGYLEVCRRAFMYCLRDNSIEFTYSEVDAFMKVWQELAPFEDATKGLARLSERYRLVALSNGEPWFLGHLVKNRIRVDFNAVISVEVAGAFKPHPSVYRAAARILESEPHEIMMVAAHSFDIMGARACGYRGAFVNRYGLPFEETPYQPDIVVDDFTQLADRLLDGSSHSQGQA